MLELPKYSFGVGDRFGLSARAQLRAIRLAAEEGIDVTPVWNKSNREHLTIGSEPADTLRAARHAVDELGWRGSFLVDADHVNLATVDRFIAESDYFTIDVADWIGRACSSDELDTFLARHPELVGETVVEGIKQPIRITRSEVERIARHYLAAAREAGRIHDHVRAAKGEEFVTEVSMDETDHPQTPRELLVILAALADQEVPVQSIAPKFTGRFNKGVDYEGDLDAFEREFNDDLAVLGHAVKAYGLPEGLKLSVHSGSDKFSIYPRIRTALHRHDAGVHVKTAGTSWLEEVIGLAEAGGAALSLAQDIYRESLERIEELCAPYATVISIDRSRLPSAAEVGSWSSDRFVRALRHDPTDPYYHPHLRQLLHVGYKVAAGRGSEYLDAVRVCSATVEPNVTRNLLERHIRPLFAPSES